MKLSFFPKPLVSTQWREIHNKPFLSYFFFHSYIHFYIYIVCLHTVSFIENIIQSIHIPTASNHKSTTIFNIPLYKKTHIKADSPPIEYHIYFLKYNTLSKYCINKHLLDKIVLETIKKRCKYI